jgi:hypothetical protein
MAVEGAEACSCKFEAMEAGVKRYRFKLADCAAIVDELELWTGAAFFRVKGLTNGWTYSTRRSGAALKDLVPTRYSGCAMDDKRADLIEE